MRLLEDKPPRKVYLTKEHVFSILEQDQDPDQNLILEQLKPLPQPLPELEPGQGSEVL